MAYYTGSAVSFADLQAAVATACQAHGWLWQDGILSKGRAFVKLSVATTTGATGLLIEGGTGRSGLNLLNPSGAKPRLGRPGTSSFFSDISWPAQYHIHVGESPDEVYVVLNTGISDFYWLAWGLSAVPLPGTGLWLAGSAAVANVGTYGLSMSHDYGNSNENYLAPALFWATQRNSSANNRSCLVQVNASGDWAVYTGAGVATLAPLLNRQPNTWNSEAVLLPAREWEVVAQNKLRLLVDCAHARILRIHNFVPGDVILLGEDRWRVYPFFRKDASTPNGGNNHTGTFGWALREG